VDISPPLQFTILEQSRSKAKAVRKDLEFGAGGKENLQLENPVQDFRQNSHESLCGGVSLTVQNLGASGIRGSTSGSGALGGKATRDLSSSYIVIRASDSH